MYIWLFCSFSALSYTFIFDFCWVFLQHLRDFYSEILLFMNSGINSTEVHFSSNTYFWNLNVRWSNGFIGVYSKFMENTVKRHHYSIYAKKKKTFSKRVCKGGNLLLLNIFSWSKFFIFERDFIFQIQKPFSTVMQINILKYYFL